MSRVARTSSSTNLTTVPRKNWVRESLLVHSYVNQRSITLIKTTHLFNLYFFLFLSLFFSKSKACCVDLCYFFLQNPTRATLVRSTVFASVQMASCTPAAPRTAPCACGRRRWGRLTACGSASCLVMPCCCRLSHFPVLQLLTAAYW